ncbi:MAG: acetylornithine deacetylase [Mesorhizobium sp.]|nr:acetylornithine deacetylase [Mesorhizobium sp.]
MSARPHPSAVEILSRLVAFDTTSRHSNLPLIDYAESLLVACGAITERTYDATGSKANLWATIGPPDVAGIALSGHTDTVPVDGQDWASNPFELVERDGRLYGRGACDMKGFLAVALSLAPSIAAARPVRPVHFALSYDEEVGCIGVRGLVAELVHKPVLPLGCIVGEPTLMEVAIGHKAKRSLKITVRGTVGHSSRAPEFVNAVEHAARIVVKMREMGKTLAATGARDALYDIAHTTAHVGTMHGGTALNIVPDRCEITCEFRVLPNEDADALVSEITDFIRQEVEPEMRALAPEAGVDIEMTAAFPGLDMAGGSQLALAARRAARRNDHIKVAYGTEAGLFQEAGIPTIVCGPGSIAQAHKPDEFVALEQLAACERFLVALLSEHGCLVAD